VKKEKKKCYESWKNRYIIVKKWMERM